MPLYEEYVRLLNDQKNASDDSADANLNQASSYELVQQSIDDAIAAHKAEEEALKAERKAAFDTYDAQVKLASATEDAAAALASKMGVPQEFADKLVGIGEAARDAAAEAEALTSALDLLMSPMLTQQEAISNYEAGIDDLTAAMEENGKTLDLGTEAGRTNAEQIRTNIGSITEWAAAQLAAGESDEDTAPTPPRWMTEALDQPVRRASSRPAMPPGRRAKIRPAGVHQLVGPDPRVDHHRVLAARLGRRAAQCLRPDVLYDAAGRSRAHRVRGAGHRPGDGRARRIPVAGRGAGPDARQPTVGASDDPHRAGPGRCVADRAQRPATRRRWPSS